MRIVPRTFADSLEKTKHLVGAGGLDHACEASKEACELLAKDVAPEELAGFLKGLFVAEGVLNRWKESAPCFELLGCVHEVVHLLIETSKAIEAKNAENFEFPKTIGG
jgi:hypothetical protein